MATTLAASRRQGDGYRRVSFQETRMTSSRLYDSDEDIEEEEERELSERHGEAEEGGDPASRKRKKEESDKSIAEELAQEEQKKTKRLRPQLLPKHLTDHNGLIKLPIEFKRIKYKPQNGKKRDVLAAAAYSQNLVTAYHSFCHDLFPSGHFEDSLLKIEQLGSKKEVKDFLDSMRNNVRNSHLEHLYGRQKAERMLQELDDGLKLQDRDDVEPEMFSPDATDKTFPSREVNNPQNLAEEEDNKSPSMENGHSMESISTTGHSVVGPESDDEEQEATFEDEEQEATFEEKEHSPTKFPLAAEPPSKRPEGADKELASINSSDADVAEKQNTGDEEDGSVSELEITQKNMAVAAKENDVTEFSDLEREEVGQEVQVSEATNNNSTCTDSSMEKKNDKDIGDVANQAEVVSTTNKDEQGMAH